MGLGSLSSREKECGGGVGRTCAALSLFSGRDAMSPAGPYKKKTYLFVSGVRWLPANLCMCALTITGKNKDKEEGKKTQANKIFIYVDIQKVVVVVVAGGGKSVS